MFKKSIIVTGFFLVFSDGFAAHLPSSEELKLQAEKVRVFLEQEQEKIANHLASTNTSEGFVHSGFLMDFLKLEMSDMEHENTEEPSNEIDVIDEMVRRIEKEKEQSMLFKSIEREVHKLEPYSETLEEESK